MDLKLYRQNLIDIYFVSNTPLYLFDILRKSAVVEYLSHYNERDLIDNFEERVKLPITNAYQIVELYAIAMALSFKSSEEADNFINDRIGKIQFEWFSKIPEYVNSKRATQASSFNLGNHDVHGNIDNLHNFVVS